MKGLIIKDFYMIKKYLKFYLLMVAAFSVAHAAGSDSMFFLIYPTVLSGVLINTLLSYDETFGFMQFADSFPISRKAFVISKYMTALIVMGIMAVINTLSVSCHLAVTGNFSVGEVISTVSLLVLTNVLGFAVMVPLTFRFGNEKGRIVFILTIGLLSAVFMGVYSAERFVNADNITACVVMLISAAVVFIVSMYISVKFFENREL